MQKLRVSDNRHFFETTEGQPYFYLGDTAWLLFNKLTIEEVETLFKDRVKKGFNAVQAVVFRDLFEPNSANAYGVRPFASEKDFQAVRMNPEWIGHVRRVVKLAERMGLYLGLLPTWGDKWNEHSNSAGPVIMDVHSGKAYCRFLSDELGDCPNIIWMLGGDSPIQTQAHADIVHAMAEGLRDGKSSDGLITFYPCHDNASDVFHSAPWLDFNCLQSGHAYPNIADYKHIEYQYRLHPPKPALNLEANFENCPSFALLRFGERPPKEPLYSAYDVRKCLYRSVLAGAAGFAYGCEPIRQLYRKGDRVHVYWHYDLPEWTEGLQAPGSSQLHWLPNWLQDRPYFTRVPAQELLLKRERFIGVAVDRTVPDNDHPAAHIRVARCAEGSYILAYLPVKQLLELDVSGLSGDSFRVTELNPETGETFNTWVSTEKERFTFIPRRDLDTFVILDGG